MSSGEVRRVSREDIQLVQNLIERCLQLYMTRKEVVDTLLVQAKIEPDFTELVWQKLEEENKEFFKAYHVRLLVKQQITAFNELLEKQAELMHKICPAGVGPMPNSNGSNATLRTLTQTPACYISDRTIPPSRMENMHYPISSNTSSTIINNGPLVCHTMQTASDASAQTQRTDVSSNTLSTQNSQMGMVQRVNSVVIKQEAGYSNSSNFTVGSNHNGLDMHPTIVNSPVALLNGVDSNSQQLNDPVDAETSAFGFLGQIPRNFSLSDLTADFNQSSDILESYSRSPFLVTNPEDFLESPRGECLGDNNRLDTISEGLSYDEFASD